MKKLIVRFIREEGGQDLIEYALLGGLITAVGGALIKTMGTDTNTLMSKLSDVIAGK